MICSKTQEIASTTLDKYIVKTSVWRFQPEEISMTGRFLNFCASEFLRSEQKWTTSKSRHITQSHLKHFTAQFWKQHKRMEYS